MNESNVAFIFKNFVWGLQVQPALYNIYFCHVYELYNILKAY